MVLKTCLRAAPKLMSLLCSADGNYEVRYKSNVLIYPTGEVLWVPPAIYQVRYYKHISFISKLLVGCDLIFYAYILNFRAHVQ
jgi:hypothetical protein